MTTDPTGHLAAAMRAFESRDRDGAALAIRDLIAAAPPIGKTWTSVGRMAAILGEIDSAIAADRLMLQDAPAPAARLEFAQKLAQYGRHAEAIRIGEALQKEYPSSPSAWHFTGVCRAEIGETEGAIADLRKALPLSQAPLALAWTWQTLAGLKTFRADDPDLAAIEGLLARPDVGPSARSILLYAQGKALDDIGRTDEAFAAYSEGAALADHPTPEANRARGAYVDTMISAFDADLSARLAEQGEASDRPIFVLGMPRSGSTLVEQILVSHPAVSDGAEINLFTAATMPVGALTPAGLSRFVEQRPNGLREVARAYLDLLSQRFGSEGRIIDKTLSNTRLVGPIKAALPNARFIWLQRSPGAVAWSCFRTRFARGLDWTWSLQDIAGYMRDEDRLHAHWTALYPDAILTVPYEELVSSPETWIPRIAEHVGLETTDAMLTPHLTARAVPSASFAQVRRPISTGSIDAWRRYEGRLKPFFEAYQAD
ncbi:MAG: hypothetical protein EON90_08995 [Brevundimonas sp.]|nr:MAG: hypothetical protein EON90_08995 [Brevundimonas sp.]